MYNINIIVVVINKYKPILVKDNCIYPNKSALRLSKSLMVNWSSGLWFMYVISCIYIYFVFCIGH